MRAAAGMFELSQAGFVGLPDSFQADGDDKQQQAGGASGAPAGGASPAQGKLDTFPCGCCPACSLCYVWSRP